MTFKPSNQELLPRFVRWSAPVLLFALALSLSSCITTTTGGFEPEVSTEQAVIDYSRLAKAYLEAGDLVAARRHANNALALDPNSADSIEALALVAQREADEELADELFRRALRASPGASRIRNNYAAALFAAGRLEEALGQLQRVVTDTSYEGRAHSYENLGLVAKQLAEAAAAKAAFARVLQLDDSLVQSALELGILSVDEDNWDAAREFFERYLEAREARGMSESLNHSAEALLLGRALAKQAGDQDAAALWERALRSLYPELELEQETAEQ